MKISKDLEDEEMEELFEKAISRNCCRYYHIDNKELITKVETLWMISHQRTQVPCNRMINKVEAKGIIYEWKGKPMNWCVFVRWMIWDQL
jgi:predicted GNAT family N-acyltransferase